jgi:hypothetical protein
MAIELEGSVIIDDDRNLIDASVGTFLDVLNVGVSGSLFKVETYSSSPNSFEVYDIYDSLALSVGPVSEGISSINIGATNQLKIIPQSLEYSIKVANDEIINLAGNSGSENVFSVVSGANTLFTTAVNGKVGIGIASPTETLHILGDSLLLSDGTNDVFKASKTGTNSLSVFTQTGSSAFEITPDGKIGIGTSSPTNLFQIVSGESQILNVSSASGTSGELIVDGTLTVNSGFIVSNLPTPTLGMIARVTDALSPTIGSAVVGGGAVNALCWYNGTDWTVTGV